MCLNQPVRMMKFKQLFQEKCSLIGMVHVQALPGAPAHALSVQEIVDRACGAAEVYAHAGWHGLMIENMHDVPYLNRRVGPEITAAMTAVAREVRKVFGGPLGIQILAGANREAVAVAQAAGLNFVRAEGFVYGHLADEGWMDSDAGALLRYRHQIGAEEVLVLTDIKKKHSAHALSSDVSIAQTARAAEFFRSDGVIVTGPSTGASASIYELEEVREATSLPVLVGSGVTAENMISYAERADAIIVGSSVKFEGDWRNPPDPSRVDRLMAAISI